MDNYSMKMTAWTPPLGMSPLGHRCVQTHALGAGVAAAMGDVRADVRIKGDFPGSDTWSPPIC